MKNIATEVIVGDHFHFLQNSLLTQCAAAVTEGFYLTTIPASVFTIEEFCICAA